MAARSSDDESDQCSEEQQPDPASGSDESAAEGNEAWADVLSKLLRTKEPRTKTPILFKAKKDGQQKRQKPTTVLEIVGEEGEVKEQETQKLPDEPEFLSRREIRERKEKRRQWEEMSRIKPVHDDCEKRLRSIATRGVVQLFNAVKAHQKEVDEKLRAAGQIRRKHHLTSSSHGECFRDDFMLGAEMKDWDKEEEEVS
ncbi:hypothetical protein MRX96_054937 [Rhipicephalus microplus]